jgi:hypothetical protein
VLMRRALALAVVPVGEWHRVRRVRREDSG